MNYNPNPKWIEPIGWIFAAIQGILISGKMLGVKMSWLVALLPVEIIAFIFLAFTVALFILFARMKWPEDNT